MTRHDLPPVARRLDAILRDLEYLNSNRTTNRSLAYRVIDRRSRVLGTLTEARFVRLCKGEGPEMTVEEAATIAGGLGIDVRRIIYDEDEFPRHPERPRNLLDELTQIGSPE